MELPKRNEIEQFCKKVISGEIYLEYETHYYEFDDDGRYMDDWKSWYNDPFGAMQFIDVVLKGCHKLNKIAEYQLSYSLFEKICYLQFRVVAAEDTEDTEQTDEQFTIESAYKNGMLHANKTEVIYDWFQSFYMVNKEMETTMMAQKVLNFFMLPLASPMLPSNIERIVEKREIFKEICNKLEHIVKVDEEGVQEKYYNHYSREGYYLKEKLEREKALLEDILDNIDNDDNEYEKINKRPVLKVLWKRIQELIQWLSCEAYINDQVEIGEIRNLCDVLTKHCKEEDEPWKIRKLIMKDIIDQYAYARYACSDSMKSLLSVLCNTEEEYIEKADYMMEKGTSEDEREAADLYRKYGRDEEYLLYLNNNLIYSTGERYWELIQYYDTHDQKEKAIEIARTALCKCRDAKITDIFIYLIKEACQAGDKVEAKKLHQRAKRRVNVRIADVDKALEGVKSDEKSKLEEI